MAIAARVMTRRRTKVLLDDLHRGFGELLKRGEGARHVSATAGTASRIPAYDATAGTASRIPAYEIAQKQPMRYRLHRGDTCD